MSEQDQAFFYQNQKLNRFSVHAKEFLYSFATRNAFALVAVWLLLIAVPLTVKIAQKQQEIRQRAEDTAYTDTLQAYNDALANGTPEQQQAAYQAAIVAYNNAYGTDWSYHPDSGKITSFTQGETIDSSGNTSGAGALPGGQNSGGGSSGGGLGGGGEGSQQTGGTSGNGSTQTGGQMQSTPNSLPGGCAAVGGGAACNPGAHPIGANPCGSAGGCTYHWNGTSWDPPKDANGVTYDKNGQLTTTAYCLSNGDCYNDALPASTACGGSNCIAPGSPACTSGNCTWSCGASGCTVIADGGKIPGSPALNNANCTSSSCTVLAGTSPNTNKAIMGACTTGETCTYDCSGTICILTSATVTTSGNANTASTSQTSSNTSNTGSNLGNLFLGNIGGGSLQTGNDSGGSGGSGGSGATTPPTTTAPIQTGSGGGTGTPSPTQTGRNVKLALSLALQAIGNTGSNSSPTGSGNKNPKHATRTVSIELYDHSGTKVGTAKSGQLTFDAGSGLFKGTVDIGNQTLGTYTIYIKSDRYLRRRVPGFQTLTAGTVTVPQATLIAGDINGDNKLDILDYNIISDCYGGKFNSASCQAHAEKNNTDVNDDGVVDGIDYNFFISNLSTSVGD